MPDESYDWADDDSLGFDETMRIFEALGPDIELTGLAESRIAVTAAVNELGQPLVIRTYVSSVTRTEDIPAGTDRAEVAIRPTELLTA